MRSLRTSRINLMVLGVVLSLLAPVAQAGYGDQVVLGDFMTTDLGQERGFAITGRAMMVRRGAGTTEVYTQVLGLSPSTSYAAHVHDLPCDLGGGGHYKIDPAIAGTVRENEIWPLLQADANGAGKGFDQAAHIARPEAQSIVVHDPADGGRIACADLLVNSKGSTLHKGEFKTFAAGIDLGLEISGTAQIIRSNKTTYVTTSVQGLPPSSTLPVHVHNLPCDVSNGGGHYKIDPAVAGTVRENEIWPAFTTDADGAGSGADSALHVARPEAQSIVVHATNGARIACADLLSTAKTASVTRGKFLTTAVGLSRGFDIDGDVLLLRQASGATFVRSIATGLKPFETYPSHVHNLPCRLGGGGHYKIDPSVPGVIEENEIWPALRAYPGKAIGFDFARGHTARPEAQSVVVHDPEDGARLACADLD